MLELTGMELSPEDTRKDRGGKIDQSFVIKIYFSEYCTECKPSSTPMRDLCDQCIEEMGEETFKQWLEATEITNRHDYPTIEQGQALLPFYEHEDMAKAMEN